jgi:SAM-dependent methyltransferase
MDTATPGTSRGPEDARDDRPDSIGVTDASGARAQAVPCPVCGQDEPRPYRRDMYRMGALAFHLVRCPCGMVYINPRPDEATLRFMYDDPTYYEEGYTCGVDTMGYFERREEMLAEYDGAYARLERETGLASGGALVELGSAGGFFLEAGRRRGWRVQGVELSPRGVAYSRAEFGLEIFQGPLDEVPYEPGSLDVAVADNVLEHTSDPTATLVRLRGLLRPGGHLLVVVPSYVNSVYFRFTRTLGWLLPRRFLGARMQRILKLEGSGAETCYPYHILEFDRRSLARVIEAAGFELVSIEGSTPIPGHLFRARRPGPAERLQLAVFRALDGLMRAGLAPGTRLRVLARTPRASSVG